MHILDFVMYFVTVGIIWFILGIISDGEFTEEIGGALVGFPVIVVWTIIYFILFVWPIDLNWVDLFKGTWKLKLEL